jgi:hypothetical protein
MYAVRTYFFMYIINNMVIGNTGFSSNLEKQTLY